MAILDSGATQFGLVQLDNAGGTNPTTVTVTLGTAVNASRSIVFFSQTGGKDGPSAISLRMVRILSGNDLTSFSFTRNNAAADSNIQIRWRVMTFTSGISVQEISATGLGATENISIPTSTTGAVVLLASVHSSSSSYNDDDAFTFDQTSVSNILIEAADGGSGTRNKSVQVIEFTDGATAQKFTHAPGSFSTATSVAVAAFTTVDPLATMISVTKRENGSLDAWDTAVYRCEITGASDDAMTFTRVGTAATGSAITWIGYLVSFTDGTSVERGSVLVADGSATATVNLAFSNADIPRCVNVPGCTMHTQLSAGGCDTTSTLDGRPNTLNSQVLDTVPRLLLTRQTSTSDVTMQYRVIGFNESAAGPIDASGALALAAVQLAGVAEIERDASASLTLASLILSGVSAVEHDATSALTVAALSLVGASDVERAATGALAVAALAAAGSSEADRSASAALTLASIALSGQATVDHDVNGALALASLGVVGVVDVSHAASAALILAALAIAGQSSGEEPDASGALTLAPLDVAGASDVERAVSAALAMAALALSGQSTVDRAASSALVLSAITTVGSASPEAPSASAALTLQSVVLAGASSIDRDAVGALALTAIQLAGQLSPDRDVSGVLALSAVALSGAAEAGGSTATGSIVVPIEVSGAAVAGPSVTGVVTVPILALVSAATRAVGASGVVAMPTVVPSGVVGIERSASGALSLAVLAVAGGAGPSPPEASGAIALPTVSVVGSAFAVRVATGGIVVVAPVVSGTIARAIASTGAIALPTPTAAGQAALARVIDGAVDLPTLILSGVSVTGAIQSVLGLAAEPTDIYRSAAPTDICRAAVGRPLFNIGTLQQVSDVTAPPAPPPVVVINSACEWPAMVNILNEVTATEAVTANFDFSAILTTLLANGQAVYFPDRWTDPDNPGTRLHYHLSEIDIPNGARIHVEKNQTIRGLLGSFRDIIFRTNRSSGVSDVHISGGKWQACDIVFWQEHASGVIAGSLFEHMEFGNCIDGIRATGMVTTECRNITLGASCATGVRLSGIRQSNNNVFSRFKGNAVAGGVGATHLAQIDTDGLLLGAVVFEDSNGGAALYTGNFFEHFSFEDCGFDAPYTPTTPDFIPLRLNGDVGNLVIRESYFEDNYGSADISMTTNTADGDDNTEVKDVLIQHVEFAPVGQPLTPMTRRINLEGRIGFRIVDNQAVVGQDSFVRLYVNTGTQAVAFREFDGNFLQGTAPNQNYIDALVQFDGAIAPTSIPHRYRVKPSAFIDADTDKRWVEVDWA